MNKNYHEKGMDILNEILGEKKKDYINMLDSLHEGMGNEIVETVFGKIYSRDHLSLKTRELITVSFLLVNGSNEQLEFHIRCAMHLGVKYEEIVEVMIQGIPFIGLPKALNGIKVLKELISKENEF